MGPLLVPISAPKNWEGPSAASMLGLSREAIKRLIVSGELESVKHGRRRLVVVESIHGYVGRKRTGARGAA